MKEKKTNYKALTELSAFAADAEGDIGSLSKQEIGTRLSRQGIDPIELARRAERTLKRIRNEQDARQAAKTPDRVAAARSIDEMRKHLQQNFAYAARANAAASDEDIRILYRLSLEGEATDERGTED